MTPRWHIGAKDLRGAISAYAKRFDLLEVRVALGDGREKTEPSLATLKRWRKAVPPHFDFSVVAGPHLSSAKASDLAQLELDAARAAIDALQARCFVLRTPAEVTPTSLWRGRIGKIVERVPHDVTHFVWDPAGLWELDDAAAQARSFDAVLAVDPAQNAVPRGPVAYLRLRALGATRSFGPAALDRIVQAVGPRRDVFAVIETDTALQEAKRLRSLVKSAGSSKGVAGGLQRVRPRGDIVVRDDEQE
ncbi:MAG: DUF72 domain-containing protein [Polyangiaceae bacterium]|jgi:uncharacterized protein YecE (DUF72 family)